MCEWLSVFMLVFVRFKFAVVALIPVFLSITACGGSGHSSSSSVARTASTSTSSTSAAAARASTTHSRALTTATNVRIPVRFEVLAGGKLSPPQISIPAKLPIQVTVVSKDGRGHHVVVLTTSLQVPASGQVSRLLPGPRAGRYPVKVDGATAGLLVTGVNPGP